MHYKYVAIDRTSGSQVKGFASTSDIPDLVLRLKNDGLLPLKIIEIKNKKTKTFYKDWGSPASGKELAIFTRQVAATLQAGLLLTEALEAIADDLENKKFREIISNIIEDIRSGTDFSSALAKFQNIFSVTYVAIVKSGEATGNLHEVMRNLAQYLESSERLKEKVKNAVQYPTFVLAFAFFVLAVIVLFLIPKFHDMFLSAGAKLPFLTQLIVDISNFCLKFSPFILLGFIALGFLFIFLLRYRRFRYMVDTVKIKLPVIGKDIIHKALVSKFCRTLGFLFQGGVGLAKALDITSQVADHELMCEAISQIKNRVISGASLGDEIKKQKIFSALAAKMVAVGEKTGRVSDMLTRTSDYYDEEIDNTLQRLTTLIEPALIIFVGGIVLVVVIAIYLPIFQMSLAVR